MCHKALYDISVLVYVYVLLPKMKYCHKYIFSRRILTRLDHLPVFDDGVNYRALRVDIGRNVNVSVAAQVRGSPVQEEQSEALEVMVGGAASDGEARHAGENPNDR